MNKIHLSRPKRVKMFLHEYYFGQKGPITFIRLVMGPVLPLIGMDLYNNAQDKFGIAYAGFCIAFGIYYILKPALWILSHWKAFKTIDFQLELTSEVIRITEEKGHCELELSGFKNIWKRKFYFALATDTHQKIYLPNECLSSQEINTLEMRLKASNNT